jgi:hypothetical protein
MALAKVALANSAAAANGTTRTSSALSAAAAVGDVVVVDVVIDNTGTSGAAPTHLQISDTKNNAYASIADIKGGPATTNAGTYTCRFYCRVTAALTTSDTVTVTTSASAAIGFVVSKITATAGSYARPIATTSAAVTAGTTATTTTGTLVVGDLVLGATGVEQTAAPTADSDTSNGSWAAAVTGLGGNSGTSATNQIITVQSKVVTATTAQTYNTAFASGDAGIMATVFRETAVPTGPTITGVSDTVTYTGGGQPQFKVPATAAIGDMCVVGVATQSSITVTTPSGWTKQAGSTPNLAIYSKVLVSGEPGSLVQFTISSTFFPCVMGGFTCSGFDTSSPFTIGTISTLGFTNTATTGSLTTTTANNLLFAFCGHADGDNPRWATTGTGWLELTDSHNGQASCASAWQYQAAAGAANAATFTGTVAGNIQAITIAVQPAPSNTNIALSPATINLVEPGLGITAGGTTAALSPATITLAAQPLTIAAPPQTIALSPATITLVPQAMAIGTAVPPTLVNEADSGLVTAGVSTRSVTGQSVQVGDLIVVYGLTEGNGFTLTTPTDGVNTYTLRQSDLTAGHGASYLWTAIASTTTTLTISTTISASAEMGGLQVEIWRNHGGLGNTNKAIGTGAPSVALTATGAQSAMSIGIVDWGAVDGTTRTRLTVNGSTGTEEVYLRSAADATFYGARWSDVGAAGSKTLGYSLPSTMDYSILATEIKAGTGVSGQSIALSPATITLAPQAQGTTPGTASVALAPATINLVEPALGVSAGNTSPALSPATINLASQALGRTAAASVALAPATITLVEPALGVAAGNASAALAPATINLAAQALGRTTGNAAVALAPATIALVPQALDRTSAISIALNPSTVQVQAQAVGRTPGNTNIAASPATVTLVAQVLGQNTSASIPLSPATVSLIAQALGVSGITPISLALSPATITLVPQAGGLNAGGVNLGVSPATIVLQPQAMGRSAAASVALSPSTITLQPQALDRSAAVSLALAPAIVALAGPGLGLTPGGTSISASPAIITLVPQGMGVNGAGSISLSLAPATIVLVPQAAGLTTGGTSIAANPSTITLVPQALARSASASLALSPAQIAVAAQGPGISAATSLALSPATILLVPQAVGRTTGPVSLGLNPAVIQVVAVAVGLASAAGPQSIALNPAVIQVVPVALDKASGAISIPLSPGTITVAAQSLSRSADRLMALSPATIALAAQPMGRIASASLPLTPAVIVLVPQALGRAVSGVSVALSPATIQVIAVQIGAETTFGIVLPGDGSLRTRGQGSILHRGAVKSNIRVQIVDSNLRIVED